MAVGEIFVRQSEIAVHSPFSAPGIAHDEAALRLFITHREDRVAALDLFMPYRHRSATGVRDFHRVEAFVHGKPENEWITGGETSFHVRERSPYAVVSQGRMFGCFDVTFSRRLLPKLSDPILP